MPSGVPGGGPGTSGCLPSAGPDAGASGGGGPSSGGGGGGGGEGGGAVTVTVDVDGGGGVGVGLVDAGLAGGGGGNPGAAALPGRAMGRAAGLEGAPAMIEATTVPWLSQSVSPPLGRPCT